MSESTHESEPVEAKTPDEPSTKDPYTAVKNVGQLEADAQVILKVWTEKNALFASGPDPHGKSSFHNQEADLLSTANSETARAVTISSRRTSAPPGGTRSDSTARCTSGSRTTPRR